MSHNNEDTYSDTLDDSGATADLIRSIDWSNHSLGPYKEWSASLHITLGLLLKSSFPMVLFWGEDLVCFHNDAYRQFLNTEDQSGGVVGQKGAEIWPEKWDAIKSKIGLVYQEGKAKWDNEGLLNKSTDAAIWESEFSPVNNKDGEIVGVLVICKETTPMDEELQAYKEKNRILESITDGFFEIEDDWTVTEWNQKAEELLKTKQEEILEKKLWDVFPAEKAPKSYSEYKKAIETKQSSSFEEYFEPLGKWFSANVYPSERGVSVYFRDTTEQRRLQLINQRTEEISGVAGWEYDVATQHVFLTPEAHEIYGLPKEQLIDLETNEELFDKQSLAKIEEALERAIKHKESYKIELNLKQAEEDNKIIEVNGFPLSEDGKVTKVYGTLEDITEEKRRKEEREEVFKRLKTAQRIAQLGYWTHDLVEDKANWSEEVYRIWEREPDKFKSPRYEQILEAIHPDDRERVRISPEEEFPGDNFDTVEHRIITPDGKIKWILERVTLHRDEEGNPLLLEGISQDITEQKKQQQELEKAYERLKTAHHIAKMGYWTHDIRKNESEWSEEVYNIWERDPENFTPNFDTMLETIHPEDREPFLGDAEEAFPDQNFYDTEHRIISPEGKIKWILQRITLHRDKEGNPQWLEGIAQDITKQKKQEEKIREALKEKETLLSEVHHRVKNNLAVVSGMMQLQAYEEENEVIKERLLNSVVRIISMASIHEQLYQSNNFSKLNFSENLKALVKKVIDAMQTQADIELEFDCEPIKLNVNQAIPLSLITNEVITNILKHAFKGKDKGKIRFELAEDDEVVILSIRDNGIGLPKNFNIDESSTLGHRLIDILTKQMEAEYSYVSDDGTVFTIQFVRSETKGVGSANF